MMGNPFVLSLVCGMVTHKKWRKGSEKKKGGVRNVETEWQSERERQNDKDRLTRVRK